MVAKVVVGMTLLTVFGVVQMFRVVRVVGVVLGVARRVILDAVPHVVGVIGVMLGMARWVVQVLVIVN